MVRFTVPVVLGMAVASSVAPSVNGVVVLFVISAIAAFVSLHSTLHYRWRWWRGALMTLMMFAFGAMWVVVRDAASVPRSIHHQLGHEGPWLVRTITLNRVTDDQLRADAEVLAYFDSNEWRPAKGTIMLTTLRQGNEHPPRVGDRLLVEAPMKRIQRVPDPGGFDRQVWAAARGIELELFATWDQWRRIDHTTTWIDHFSAMRQSLANWVDEADLSVRERALVKALVLGQRDELDSDQRTAFARSGTIHVLAVSGMHVGLIYLVLGTLFRWFGAGRWARIIRGICIIAMLWIYAGITGGAPSVIRATVMFSFITLAEMTRRRTDGFNSIFAAMFLLLLWDPSMLGIIGFQLSFLAVLGILLFFKPLEQLWTPRTWIMRKIWSLAVLSVAAQSLTTPASLYYFKAFPIWFLPANLIVVTAVTFSVYASIALIIFHKIPIIGTLVTWLLTTLLTVVSEVTEFFSALPYAYPVFRIGPFMVVLLYIILLALAAWWLWRWRSMRWVGAVASVVFLLVWGSNAQQMNNTNVFTIYDEREGVLAGITRGREHVVLVDPDRLAADPYKLRKLDQHRKAAGLKHIEILPPVLLGDGNIDPAGTTLAAGLRWTNGTFDVLFVNNEQPVIPPRPNGLYDAVIIHDMERISEEILIAAAEVAQHVVIAGRTHWRSREEAVEWCREQGVQVHDVFAHGAFILRN